MDNNFSLIQAVRIILKWKWLIGGLTVLSALISAIVALWILPVYYESTSTFYPLNQGITDRSTLFSTQAGESRVDYFGTNDDANRILTIANSTPVIDLMINHFNLPEHYDIENDDKYWRTKTRKKFEKNFSAIQTERDAISITIFDEDPVLAATMVNFLVEKIDELNKQAVTESKSKLSSLFKSKLEEKQAEVTQLTDSLISLRERFKINEMVDNDENLVVSGKDPKGIENYKMIRKRQQNAIEELNTISTLSGQYEVSAGENVSSIYILEIAYPAEKKSKPVRFLVVITTTFITFFVLLIGVLVIDQYQKLMNAVNES